MEEPCAKQSNKRKNANIGGSATSVIVQVEKNAGFSDSVISCENSDGPMPTPRKKNRETAYKNRPALASEMKTRVHKKNGPAPKLGDAVQLEVHNVATTKLMQNHITAVDTNLFG